VLKKTLANIYNASLKFGTFPNQLKIAKVVSLYKKWNKRDIQNYKPIVLLSAPPPPKKKIAREIDV
jgi:hypothetical protein